MSQKKSDIIKRLLEMQKKFIDFEHKNGVSMGDYYAAPKGHPLENYRQEYQALAKELVDMAHSEVGSRR